MTRSRTPLRSLLGLVTRREPSVTLPTIRVALALASLLQLAEVVPILRDLAGTDVVRTPYLARTPDLPASAVPIVAVVWGGASLATLVGWRTAIACPFLAGVELVVLLSDRQLYSNHFTLLTILVLLLALVGGGAPRVSAPGWTLDLMRLQMTSVYLFAGLSKLDPDFLAGRVLAHYLDDTPLPVPGEWLAPENLAPVAVAVVLTELLLAVGLWVPRLRSTALSLGLVFHISILVALGPTRGLVVFALASLSVYPLFLSRPFGLPPAIGRSADRDSP